MKDLQARDILTLKKYALNRISVYVQGTWRFVLSLGTPVKITTDASYYKMNTKFGISYSNKRSADNPYITGKSGDYIIVTSASRFGVVTKEEYSIYFPKQKNSDNSNNQPTITSESLKDPNFLTNIIRDNK